MGLRKGPGSSHGRGARAALAELQNMAAALEKISERKAGLDERTWRAFCRDLERIVRGAGANPSERTLYRMKEQLKEAMCAYGPVRKHAEKFGVIFDPQLLVPSPAKRLPAVVEVKQICNRLLAVARTGSTDGDMSSEQARQEHDRLGKDRRGEKRDER